MYIPQINFYVFFSQYNKLYVLLRKDTYVKTYLWRIFTYLRWFLNITVKKTQQLKNEWFISWM